MKDYQQIRYVCNNCSWEWETLSIIVENDCEECPNCGSFDTRESAIAPDVNFVHFTEFGLN